MKKYLIIIVFAIIVSVLSGKYIFSFYDEPTTKPVVSNTKESVYIIQQGVYSTEANAKNNSKDLDFYIIEKDNNYYKVYVGITQSEEMSNKIKEIYNSMGKEIYIWKKDITNETFSEILKQYDKLLKEKTSNEEILNIESQVLSKYEELIIRNYEGDD